MKIAGFSNSKEDISFTLPWLHYSKQQAVLSCLVTVPLGQTMAMQEHSSIGQQGARGNSPQGTKHICVL